MRQPPGIAPRSPQADATAPLEAGARAAGMPDTRSGAIKRTRFSDDEDDGPGSTAISAGSSRDLSGEGDDVGAEEDMEQEWRAQCHRRRPKLSVNGTGLMKRLRWKPTTSPKVFQKLRRRRRYGRRVRPQVWSRMRGGG